MPTSKIDFKRLVRNLADMYQDITFDVVITELVANALDAKGGEISLDWDSQQHTLVVKDNGKGMNSEDFEEYHDFAAELKTRGDGIGFAGVGAKISFDIAKRVVTQTHYKDCFKASDWYWDGNGSLRWDDISKDDDALSDRLGTDGTRVEVHFDHEKVPGNISIDYLEGVLKRQYFPLFVNEFVRSYSEMNLYPREPRFLINGSPVQQANLSDMAALNKHRNFPVKLHGKTVGLGAIGISEKECPIGTDAYGILLCTHGKVIKQELFGLSTGMLGSKLFGIVEIPDLIKYLTTNKSGLKRERGCNQLLDPVREELQEFLTENGVAVAEPLRNQLSAKLERELTKIVRQMPELRDFHGLQRKSSALRKNESGDTLTSPQKSASEIGDGHPDSGNRNETGNGHGGDSRKEDDAGKTRAKRQSSRRNQGPRVAFESYPDREETAWLNSDTIIINSGHAAYCRQTTQNQAQLTYCMFAIGVALDKANLIESDDGANYVDKFITAWGQS